MGAAAGDLNEAVEAGGEDSDEQREQMNREFLAAKKTVRIP